MDQTTIATVGVIVLAIAVVPFYFHVRDYKRLITSMKSRGIEVRGFEPDFFDYGSGGFMAKIHGIESKFQQPGKLTGQEHQLLSSSKRAYRAQFPFVLGFFLSIGLMVLSGLWA
jgi:hypothetical protein